MRKIVGVTLMLLVFIPALKMDVLYFYSLPLLTRAISTIIDVVIIWIAIKLICED